MPASACIFRTKDFIDFFMHDYIHIYSFIYSAWRGKSSSRSSSKSLTKCNTVSKKVIGLASFSQTNLANPNRYMDIA